MILGLIIGGLSNVTSGGAGILTIFVLTSFAGMVIQESTGTVLAASTAMVGIGTFSFYSKKEIDVRLGLTVGLSGLLGAFLAARWASSIDATIMERIFGAFTLALACYTAYFFIADWRKKKSVVNLSKSKSVTLAQGEQVSVTDSKGSRWAGSSAGALLVQVAKGALIGVVTGLFGVGAASLSIVFFLLLFKLETKVVLGTSLLASFFRYLGGSIGYVTEGRISLVFFSVLAIGGCAGSILGARFLLGRPIGSGDIYIKLLQVAILVFVSYEFLLKFIFPIQID